MRKKIMGYLYMVLVSAIFIFVCPAMGMKIYAEADYDDSEAVAVTYENEISPTEAATYEDEILPTEQEEDPFGPVVEIDESAFPDAGFRQYVLDEIDTNEDGALSEAEISECVEIDISNSQQSYQISDLTGIDFFTNLEKLICNNQNLSDLDVSKNSALKYLDCANNPISKLNVNGNTDLTYLDCSDSNINNLDVSSCINLEVLYIWNNPITSIDLSQNNRIRKYVLLNTPTVNMPTLTSTGVSVTWDRSIGADGYYVYRRVKGGSWVRIATVAGVDTLSYMDQPSSSGSTYEYTIRGYYSKETDIVRSDCDRQGKSIKYIATPMISQVANVNGGIKITWGKVTGAVKYRVYYKTGSGKWKKITDTSDTSYTWKEVNEGTTYRFTVRCISKDGKTHTSSYDSKGISVKYISTPKISKVTSVNGGVEIKWGKVKGAAKYRVYYKTGSGKWTRITDTTSTSYTWKGAKSGTTYRFTVRCISNDSKNVTSGYDSKGKTLKYIAAPKLSSVTNVYGGVKIKWKKVTGAVQYRVYYKTAGGDWTRIANTSSNSYTWTGAKAGTTYTYTVRCISKDGQSFTSGFDSTGKTLKYIEAPKLSSVTSVSGGIKISWGTVVGAEKYRLYYKTASGNWKKLTDTTSTSYTWKGARQGAGYSFTVRCISKDGTKPTSGYDPVGMAENNILVLVNPTHTIPSDWTWDLVPLGGGHSIDRRAYNDLQDMLRDCRVAGGSPLICSSYRTHNRQIELYNNKVSRLMNQGYSRESAKVEAARWVALPGTSEHELGLALDIVDLYYQGLDSKQANTSTQKWLMSNSYKYGFILRYQSNKVNITGIGNEPWHYRYVGKEPATYMYQNGLCLEEYLELR